MTNDPYACEACGAELDHPGAECEACGAFHPTPAELDDGPDLADMEDQAARLAMAAALAHIKPSDPELELAMALLQAREKARADSIAALPWWGLALDEFGRPRKLGGKLWEIAKGLTAGLLLAAILALIVFGALLDANQVNAAITSWTAEAWAWLVGVQRGPGSTWTPWPSSWSSQRAGGPRSTTTGQASTRPTSKFWPPATMGPATSCSG